MPSTIETRKLTRIVGSDRIIDSISIEIPATEVVVVVGPSGAGKSSLLRLLNRLDEPTSGTVLFEGTDYRTIPPQDLRKQVGLVPQDPALIPGTVYKNVTRGPQLRGEPIDDTQVNDTLARLGLEGYNRRDIDTLSGGEAQRVAVARTLMNNPEILLLDEPTASLDPASEAQVESLLGDLIRELSLTVVMVTHDEEQRSGWEIGQSLFEMVASFEQGQSTRSSCDGSRVSG